MKNKFYDGNKIINGRNLDYLNKIHFKNISEIKTRKNIHKSKPNSKFKHISFENKYYKIKNKEIVRENIKLYKKIDFLSKSVSKKNLIDSLGTSTSYKQYRNLTLQSKNIENQKLLKSNIKMIKKIQNVKSIYNKENYKEHQKISLQAFLIKSKFPYKNNYFNKRNTTFNKITFKNNISPDKIGSLIVGNKIYGYKILNASSKKKILIFKNKKLLFKKYIKKLLNFDYEKLIRKVINNNFN